MVLAPDVVCVTQLGTVSVTDTAGVTGPEIAFAYTAIWVRRNGEWKVLLGHESIPAPEAG
ncbi:MAG: hypothetical protein GTN62_05645 [Gemmatimonadales bacterium]|nr:hypothetical protein [Gemmatimonadales bacterium]NIP07043.1 hypothetical protein [Gemmatimonadales bacterium]NIR01678.1 hypothetical protein [Gemmatimonadales bacterium]NIS65597.1 hypothetical protein [Gemmatimonadales bacterium]